MAEVPVRRLSHLSRDEVRAYILADNRLAENAGWIPLFEGPASSTRARCRATRFP